MKSVSSTSVFHRGQSWRKSLFDDYAGDSEINVTFEGEEEEFGRTISRPLEDKLRGEDIERPDKHWDLVEGKHFVYETEILDQTTQEARSTQAWLDVIIQLFRVFILNHIGLAPSLPETDVRTIILS